WLGSAFPLWRWKVTWFEKTGLTFLNLRFVIGPFLRLSGAALLLRHAVLAIRRSSVGVGYFRQTAKRSGLLLCLARPAIAGFALTAALAVAGVLELVHAVA